MKRQVLWRRRSIAVTAVLAVLLAGLAAGGVSSAAPSAHTARRALYLSGTAHLHLTRKSGSTIYERGTATGTLPGTVSARFVTGITKVTGTVTFYPYSGGSLTLSAVGYPQSAATVVHFTGSVAVRSGTGRFKHALGSGTCSGTANRRSWAITVHASAHLTY